MEQLACTKHLHGSGMLLGVEDMRSEISKKHFLNAFCLPGAIAGTRDIPRGGKEYPREEGSHNHS